MTSQYDAADGTLDLHTGEWSPLSLAELHGIWDSPFAIHIHLDECVRLLRQVEYTTWVCVELLHYLLEKVDVYMFQEKYYTNLNNCWVDERRVAGSINREQTYIHGEAAIINSCQQERQHGLQSGKTKRRRVSGLLLVCVWRCKNQLI